MKRGKMSSFIEITTACCAAANRSDGGSALTTIALRMRSSMPSISRTPGGADPAMAASSTADDVERDRPFCSMLVAGAYKAMGLLSAVRAPPRRARRHS